MRYRELGSTGLRVSEVSYGVYSLTGLYGRVDRREAVKLLRRAYDLGINLYDTADFYGFGLGESLLREAFGDGLRDVVVATKVGYDFYNQGGGKPVQRFDPGYLEFAVNKCIERLGRKPIDVLQLHNPPLDVLADRGVYLKARELVERGLVGHVGVALGPETEVLDHALEALRHDEVEVLQFVYNALEQSPGDSIAEKASEKGVGVMVRVPHAGGVLNGRLRPSDIDRLTDHRSLRDRRWYEWAFSTFRAMRDALTDGVGSLGQNAIRFILSSIHVSTVVVIARSVDELVEYANAPDLGPLGSDRVDAIKTLYRDRIMFLREAT